MSLAAIKVAEGHADSSFEALEIMGTSSKLWKVASGKALAPMKGIEVSLKIVRGSLAIIVIN